MTQSIPSLDQAMINGWTARQRLLWGQERARHMRAPGAGPMTALKTRLAQSPLALGIRLLQCLQHDVRTHSYLGKTRVIGHIAGQMMSLK